MESWSNVRLKQISMEADLQPRTFGAAVVMRARACERPELHDNASPQLTRFHWSCILWRATEES
jgi:hypothetical protein